MTKSDLRQQFLAQRRALSAEEVIDRSLAIANLLFDTFFLPTSGPNLILHTFLPIVRQNEVDTWPIIYRIWQQFSTVQVAVSVTDTTTNRLSHCLLTPNTPLIENRWGIPEPQSETHGAISSEQIDVVLVPLMVFDRHGHRVGYGKGYYDRFLVECRPDCLKVGLSLFRPVERIDNTEPTDVRLDLCITPDKTWHFDSPFSHKNTV